MDSIKNSANFELCFIFFYEHYAWVTLDPLGVPKKQKLKSSNAGNRSYQLTSAGQSAHGWQIGRHWLAGNLKGNTMTDGLILTYYTS